jgi:CBS domain-containing protein
MANKKKVSEIMTVNPDTVTKNDNIRDAARIMADRDTGVVPVVEGKKVVGLITDRDIVVRLVSEGKNTDTAKVSDAMTSSVRSVREDSPVDELVTLMSSAQIRRVPVVNSNDELVGIVSLGDISTTNQDNKVGQTLEQISEAPANN